MNIQASKRNRPVSSVMLSDVGIKRKNNEDFVDCYEPDDPAELQHSGCIYVVADGVGGASKGEVASKYAVRKVIYEYYLQPNIPPADRLKEIIHRIGNEIFNFAEDSTRVAQMATTMVVAVIRGSHLTVANVGDSRAYLIRNNKAGQITRDHNLVGEMVRDGILTEQQALVSKAKNKLTRSLGGEPDVHVDTFELDLQPGDRVFLCTDGLTRYALKSDIAALAGSGPISQAVDFSIDYALRKGGADNVTVLLAGYQLSPEHAAKEVFPHTKPPADWESIRTEYSNLGWMRSRRKKRGLLDRRNYPIIIAAMFVVIILCIGGLIFGKTIILGGRHSGEEAVNTIIPISTSNNNLYNIQNTQTALQKTIEIKLITPDTLAPSVTLTQTLTQSPTPNPILNFPPSITGTPINLESRGDSPNGKVCIIQISVGNTWADILDTFEIPYIEKTTMYDCKMENMENISCNYRGEYSELEIIKEGQFFLLPGIIYGKCGTIQVANNGSKLDTFMAKIISN